MAEKRQDSDGISRREFGTRIAAAAGIAVQSLAVHKPTLDDVFLSLTGKQKPAEALGVK